jgi:hypothetical protein
VRSVSFSSIKTTVHFIEWDREMCTASFGNLLGKRMPISDLADIGVLTDCYELLFSALVVRLDHGCEVDRTGPGNMPQSINSFHD